MLKVHGAVNPDRISEIDATLTGLTTLEQVVRALESKRLHIADVISMDEYTVDILVRRPDGLTLVFDTT